MGLEDSGDTDSDDASRIAHNDAELLEGITRRQGTDVALAHASRRTGGGDVVVPPIMR